MRLNTVGQSHYGKVKGQIKVRHDVAHLQPQPMSLQSNNFICLTVSKI